MANIFEFNGYIPVVDPSAFIHPNATITGNVVIGKNVYVGPGAALRGDWGEVIIADGCNVQENCTLHMFPGLSVVLKENAHIGHGAVIHGATIGENSLIGMNAVVMDEAIVGSESIVGALSFVAARVEIPARKVFAGNPAKEVKDVTEEMLTWKTRGTELYQRLPHECYQSLKPVRPLYEVPEDRPPMKKLFETWKGHHD